MTEEQRPDNYKNTERALKLFNELNGEDLSKTDRRLELIKRMGFDTFLRVLAYANGLLREGKPGRTTDIHESMSVSMVGVSDFESSQNGISHLEQAFNQIKEALRSDNMSHQAAKLYAAIIFTHLFEDANGRLARAAYHFINTGELVDSSKIVDRPSEVMEFAWNLRSTAVLELLSSELDLNLQNNEQFDIWEYVAVDSQEDAMLAQLSSTVRYIAAIRVLKAHNLFNGEKEIILSDSKIWTNELKAEYEKELELVKGELVVKALDLVDRYPEWTEDTMLKIFDLKPNQP